MAGRNTQGVKLVNLESNDFVMDVARVVPEDETGLEEGAEGADGADGAEETEDALDGGDE